jgi:hypothetical protein
MISSRGAKKNVFYTPLILIRNLSIAVVPAEQINCMQPHEAERNNEYFRAAAMATACTS